MRTALAKEKFLLGGAVARGEKAGIVPGNHRRRYVRGDRSLRLERHDGGHGTGNREPDNHPNQQKFTKPGHAHRDKVTRE